MADNDKTLVPDGVIKSSRSLSETKSPEVGSSSPKPPYFLSHWPKDVQWLPVDQLFPNPWNRTAYTTEGLQELVTSLKAIGVQEPLVIRLRSTDPEPYYEIICGWRRWVAATEAQFSQLPCVIRNLSDRDVKLINVTHNLAYEEIPALDKARMVHRLIDEEGLTPSEAAQVFGQAESWVAKLLNFLELPDKALENLEGVVMSYNSLVAMTQLPTRRLQIRLSREILKGTLKPGNVEKKVQEILKAYEALKTRVVKRPSSN